MDHLIEEEISWAEVVPLEIDVWLTLFAIANHIPKKMLLCTLLASISALVSKSTIEFYADYSEFCNLFILCLGKTGCGKSPACKQACLAPMRAVGREKGLSLVCDEVTQHGLFQLLLSSDESYVPLLAIDECQVGYFLAFLLSFFIAWRVHFQLAFICRLFCLFCSK